MCETERKDVEKEKPKEKVQLTPEQLQAQEIARLLDQIELAKKEHQELQGVMTRSLSNFEARIPSLF